MEGVGTLLQSRKKEVFKEKLLGHMREGEGDEGMGPKDEVRKTSPPSETPPS